MKNLKGNRKFLIALFGMVHVLIIWCASFVCGIKWPELFPNIISLSVPVTGFVGTITWFLIGGQSAVDWKNASVGQNTEAPPQQ